jgi:hypothetical protein
VELQEWTNGPQVAQWQQEWQRILRAVRGMWLPLRRTASIYTDHREISTNKLNTKSTAEIKQKKKTLAETKENRQSARCIQV